MWLSNHRPRRLNYSVNQKWAKSGSKVLNTVAHYKKLLQREKIEGKTKWIENAFKFVLVKMEKYWINPNNI